MRALLVLMAVLIFYGSIYPFNFSLYTYTPERMAQLVDFGLSGGPTGNVIANILLFVPYGIFTVFAVSGTRRTQAWGIALISFLGIVVAYGAQFAQVFIAGRVPSGVDVVWNLVGMLIGLLAGWALTGSRHRLPTLNASATVPLLLVGGWLAYQWIPFVPTLDMNLLRDNAVSFVARRAPAPFWVFQNTVLWLICYQLMERYVPQIHGHCYAPITLLVLAMGGLFVGSTVNIDDIAGATCGLILWRVLRGRWYPGVLALLLAAAIVGASYLSLTWREPPATFSWIPFSGALGSNVVLNVIATWKKLVLYGLLIWLFMEARLTVLVATAATAVLLFVSEWFQVYVQGATPEITDALIAVGIGLGLALHRDRPVVVASAAGEMDLPAVSINERAPPVTANFDNELITEADTPPVNIRYQSGWFVAATGLVLAAAVGLLTKLPEGPSAAIRGEIDWAGQRADLIANLDTPTNFPDGGPDASGLVTAATASGCDVLALSDHALTREIRASGETRSSGDRGGNREQAALSTLRETYPDLLLFFGMGLKLPSHVDRERMNLFLHPEQETTWLPRLRRAMLDAAQEKAGTPQDRDRTVLRMVNRLRDAGHPAFLIYSHPSHPSEREPESLGNLKRWRTLGARIDAIAGAPGRRDSADLDDSAGTIGAEDPWETATATVGGVWDQYVASGKDLWAAPASPNSHDSNADVASCAFSRVHIAAPERSHAGVLEALDMGTFWSDHGQLLNHLLLEVEFDGIPRALFPGESANVFTDDSVALARVVLERGPGGEHAPLEVDFISSCVDGSSQVVARRRLSVEESSTDSLIPLQATSAEDNSCIIRARVRLDQEGLAPDLLAYTNYVRVNLRLGVLDGRMLDWRLE